MYINYFVQIYSKIQKKWLWALLILLVVFSLLTLDRNVTQCDRDVIFVFPEKEDTEMILESYLNYSKFGVGHETNGKWRHFDREQVTNLSKLGRILFLGEEAPQVVHGKRYKIHVWKWGVFLERRHVRHFTEHRFDPFEKCSVNNCELTYEDQEAQEADMVIFHLHQTKSLDDLPKFQRNPDQIWTFLTDESPVHTFAHYFSKPLRSYNGLFNWSMTYRRDSDVPVPYGRTVPFKQSEKRYFHDFASWMYGKRRDVLIAILGSDCHGDNNRWDYVKKLQDHINVDVYGRCGPLKCPGYMGDDCHKLDSYKFYLAFENSNCDDYLTEKLWWSAIHKNAIPIVMGAKKKDYQQLLPPNSYINTANFLSPEALAQYILHLNNTPSEFKMYFEWKKNFKVLNEHGYFKSNSVHWCRACEALNYNSKKKKVYNDLDSFWINGHCHHY